MCTYLGHNSFMLDFKEEEPSNVSSMNGPLIALSSIGNVTLEAHSQIEI